MHPDAMYEELKKVANSRKAESLKIVHDVCREQFERGSKDFSIATIGRISEEKGGPKAQTIRNKTGDDFKGLISAWASHTGGARKREPKPSENPMHAIMEKIADPGVRAIMGMVLAENRKLKGEVNLLKRTTEITIDKRAQPSVAAPQVSHAPVQVLPPSFGLTGQEKEALQHAISSKQMEDEGWRADDSGRILNATGRPLFKAGFVTAIKKAIASS